MKLLTLVLLTAWVIQAGTLRVVVRDQSGAFVPGASVRAGQATLSTDTSGEAIFETLAEGRVEVTIDAAGFMRYATTLNIKSGKTTLERTLKLADRVDKVDVENEDDPTSPLAMHATVLTEKEIALLPDDPDQFEEALKQLAGPGAVFRVDGFRGGRLPPKDQIQSIRFRLTPYAADEHDDGFMLVDITTKPGLGAWHGTAAFAFGDDSLNARNAFAPRREQQQSRRLDLNASGPLLKNRTSLSMNFTRNDGYDSRTSIGILPEGPFSLLTRLPSLFTHGGARFNHGLSRKHLLRGEYQFDQQERSNIGNFDLPERQSFNFLQSHLLRLSVQSSVSERMINEFRMQHGWTSNGSDSRTNAPAIIVQGAFNSGGANQDAYRSGRTLELVDHLTFNRKKHSFRTGVQLDTFRYSGRDFTNGYGVTTYPGLSAYLANQPALISRRSANVAVDYNQVRVAGFFHDDIRARKNLSLSLGLRVEGMTQVDDRFNAAPRAGFAWTPFRRAKTVVRGGAGIYYTWYDASLYEQILRLNGASQVDLITSPLGAQLPGFLRTRPSLSLPYVLRSSFGVQQPLPGGINLMVDFRQERGLHQFRSLNVNTPGSGYGYLLELDSAARSRMQGVMFALSSMPMPNGKGLRSRLFWNMHYFFGRNRDEVSNPLTPPANSLLARADYGPSMLDTRHRISAMVQGTLPRGFQLGTMFFASSAQPYNVTTGFDNNRDTFFNDRPEGIGRNSQRGAGIVQLGTRLSWSHGFGERSGEGGGMMVRMHVRTDGPGAMPDMPGFSGPGSKNPLVKMQFYVQAANVFNKTNPSAFIGVQTSPFFGQATAAMPPRRVEIGTRFTF